MTDQNSSQSTKLGEETWSTQTYPQFEGCNVGTWIGFKHVMYLVEEAVVLWFREQGLGPSKLLTHNALVMDVIESRLRLIKGVRIDDLVKIELTPKFAPEEKLLMFKVVLSRKTEAGDIEKLAVGKVRAQLSRVLEFYENAELAEPKILPYIVDGIGNGESEKIEVPAGTSQDQIKKILQEKHGNSYVWNWRIPYFYCHNTYRLQMSGYIRLMEEVVDLFLKDRGISIGDMLYNKEYNWIPVVTSSRLKMLEDVLLEEELFVVYTVDNIMQDVSYTANMDCYVYRDGRLVHTATGFIGHAYIHVKDREVSANLATFDERVKSAFLNANKENVEYYEKEANILL